VLALALAIQTYTATLQMSSRLMILLSQRDFLLLEHRLTQAVQLSATLLYLMGPSLSLHQSLLVVELEMPH
jgi:hypothetical protein